LGVYSLNRDVTDKGHIGVRYAPYSGTKSDIAGGQERANRVTSAVRRRLPVFPDKQTSRMFVGMSEMCQMYGPAVRCKTEAPRPTNVRAATMYQAFNVEHLLRANMGIRAHPG
jgi:hypothetical protein